MNTLFSIMSHLILAGLAAGFPRHGALEATVAGMALLAGSILLAAHLLVRDSTPGSGVSLLVTSGAAVSVRLLGGPFSPAVALYPLLFIWMKMPSIAGSLYHGGLMVSLAELLGYLAPGWGSTVMIINLLPGALAAFAAPFLSMLGSDLLLEGRGSRQKAPGEVPLRGRETAFPEDVARSMLPLLHRSTGANGVFLVVKDGQGFRLSDFVTASGTVAASFAPMPTDPFVKAAMGADGVVTREITLEQGLPWYTGDPGTASAMMVPLARDGNPEGFFLCDFFSSPAPVEPADTLLDAAGVLSAAWEANTGPSGGMLTDACLEVGSAAELKAAVHGMVVAIARHLPGATVTVAVLTPEGRELQVYETLGSLGSMRRGKLFPADRGMAGWAVSNRRTVHRRTMKKGDMSIRPFTPEDDPHRRVGSCCAVPLFSERSIFGVLVVESDRESGITVQHSRQLEAAGALFGVFSARMVALERLEALSGQDRLTGLPLFAAFHDDLHGLVTDVRKGMCVAVLAVDIRGFSRLNREYGPRACDTIISGAARRIAGALGHSYMMTRMAPGRFLVSIPGADRAAAQACAGRVVEAFSVEPFDAGGRSVSVEVAVGGASSRVDRMIPRLPGFAEETLDRIPATDSGPVVVAVDQFGRQEC